MTHNRWQQVKSILDGALERSPNSRGAFLETICAEDLELRREVESLLEFEDAEADFIGESVFELSENLFEAKADAFIGKNFGNYKIEREIGAGGMGAVFLATRIGEEFTQRVAVKIIKRGINSDVVRRRFYRERQILANLEHPNIARLIDGGATADGLPYLVMEYVEGLPITDYAAKNNLTLTERLDLFREVCAAVSYAHRNLVVHRDLKPSNILVAKDGAPKLLDFGIAKLLSAERTNETQTHTFVFTPEYASPEQLRGETLTTATDIYSLGVILYELLTDARPFAFDGKNFGDIIITVSQIEPAKPSDAATRRRSDAEKKNRVEHHIAASPRLPLSSSQLKGDLDNIVLKALKRDAERRYSSVEQFSEDIRRHLKGLPVTARQDTLRYRAEKFTRRNPLVVGAVTLAFLILIGGILATAYQARQANIERERAERRFNDVRALANSFMFEINEKIDESPIKARELLVKRAEEYLDKLAAESEGDTGLQSELAISYQKIGDVQSELHRSNIGDTQGALENYAKALKIHEALYLAEPKNLSAGLNFSIRNYERVQESDEKNAHVRCQIFYTKMYLADALARSGKTEEALENYEKSLPVFRELTTSDPSNSEWQNYLALCHLKIGEVFLSKNDKTKALTYFEQALPIYEKLVAQSPENAKRRSDLETVKNHLGKIKSKE